ncbi:HAMP domain-containing histidine kinase [Vibrio sp. SM6]|uniref:histidine kinase n=1 Tax=Vibrio agarilyticus TaxID=2726741 RepID=A0A7X8TN42_9VIBR|nr:HAMP domain-containing sensor histidine kinase [Vibrio agarilyticus]NLS11795.1 HAMP domain-containing histidine kinase [Vibrio agarilyticus]
MSFKLRLTLFTALWFLATTAVVVFCYHQQSQIIEQRTTQSLHRDLAQHMRDDNPLMLGTDYNPVALKSIFHTLMLMGPDFEIYFLDRSGKITTHAAPPDAVMATHVDLTPIERYLQGEPFPILGQDPRGDGGKVFSVAAIEENGEPMGYLYVVIGSRKHQAIAQTEVESPYLISALVVLLSVLGFALGVYWLVRHSLLIPIERVTSDLQQQAENDFRLVPEQTLRAPELAPIAAQYQLMATHIQQQFLHLQYQSEQQRANLLALSHDLKTPLSSVLGYLETWLIQHPQGDPLIDVAYRNCQKISTHLHELLNSAKQQTGMPSFVWQKVDFAALIEEVVEGQRHTLAKRHLQCSLEWRDAQNSALPMLQALVWGDPQLLERLIANLLENAMRHAPEGSTIDISLAQQPTQRWRFIIENGVTDAAPHGDLGIGLRVVQSILLLHHSQLETQNQSGRYRQQFLLPGYTLST